MAVQTRREYTSNDQR